MTKAAQGKLADISLAEIIRELGEVSTSGALRVSRQRAKAVVYFENGSVVFVASNIRAHRLAEYLKRTAIVGESFFSNLSPKATDDEVLKGLAQIGRSRPDAISAIRANHVADVLRGLLLWTDGDWQFDSRVRIAGDTRVTVDARRLMLESTRHLPAPYVRSRFGEDSEQIEVAQLNGQMPDLLPAEAFVLSRVSGATSVKDLLLLSGLTEDETLRAIYALAICGAVKRGAWATPQFNARSRPITMVEGGANAETLEDFFARLERASDHYEMLGVARQASADELKNAYHALARRYHPDRFHRADAQLRNRIDSAFARVARAYEVLGDQSSRASYDARFVVPDSTSEVAGERSSQQTSKAAEERAESSFRKGVAAMKQNQPQQALPFLAEAASLEPRRARYRSEYGRALINDPKTRRIAETELKAAIELEPNNIAHRVALAELYKALGLRRRAAGELQRALSADPKNSAARSLLASLKTD